MSKNTKKSVIAAAAMATSIKESDIELFTDEGQYYWGGKAGSLFSDTLIGVRRLNDRPLEFWVDDFKRKVAANLNRSNYSSFQELIDSVDWLVEYE